MYTQTLQCIKLIWINSKINDVSTYLWVRKGKIWFSLQKGWRSGGDCARVQGDEVHLMCKERNVKCTHVNRYCKQTLSYEWPRNELEHIERNECIKMSLKKKRLVLIQKKVVLILTCVLCANWVKGVVLTWCFQRFQREVTFGLYRIMYLLWEKRTHI